MRHADDNGHAPSAADAVRDDNLERSSLGAFMRGARPKEYRIPPDAYANPLHRALYEAIMEADHRLGIADVAAVRSMLVRMEAPGDAVELAELLSAGDGNPRHMDGYTLGLLELHERRQHIRVMEEGITQLVKGKTRAGLIASEVSSSLAVRFANGTVGRGGDMARSLKADISEERAAMANPQHKPLRAFLPTPFAGFNSGDNPMRGIPCLKNASTLAVIAARSGIGKTALLSTLMHHWICELGMKLGLVGLEDGTRWLIERWVARDFQLDWGNVVAEAAKGNLWLFPFQVPWFPETWAEPHPKTGAPVFGIDLVLDSYEYLLDSLLVQYSGAGIASSELLSLSGRWIRQEEIQGLLVDHGLQVDYEAGKNERLDLAISTGIKGMNNLGMATGVPMMLAWHLNRRADEDAPPAMSDVKESSYVDMAAANIFGAWRHGATGRSLCNVIKSRKSGGINSIIELVWAGRSGMFLPKQCNLVDLRAEARAAREAKKAERQGKL